MLRLLLTCTLVATAFASYCGQAAVPFTFQVLRSGHPVLGCARPKCFGWTANGTRAGDSAQFYRIAGKEDGYLRNSDQTNTAPTTIPNYVPQVSVCEEGFKSNTCGNNQWVAGLTPQSDPFSSRIEYSQDRGVATVKQGQLVVGGEVIEQGKLVAFDYISNLSKEVHSNGTIVFYASIKRMPCFEDKQVFVQQPQRVESSAVNTQAQSVQPVQPVRPAPTQIQQLPSQLPQVLVNNGVPEVQQPVQPTVQQPQYVPQSQFSQVPNYGIQQQGQAQYGNGVYSNGQNTIGQFSQQGYGVGQVPQYGQPAQYGQIAQPQAQIQDPLAALIQQQNQQFQQNLLFQQQQQQQMMAAALPQYQQQVGLGINAPAVAQAAPTVVAQPASVPQAAVQVPTSTIPAITLPKFEDLPKLQIPSVEDVEQVIPPVQRAILTSVAKFFGVL